MTHNNIHAPGAPTRPATATVQHHLANNSAIVLIGALAVQALLWLAVPNFQYFLPNAFLVATAMGAVFFAARAVPRLRSFAAVTMALFAGSWLSADTVVHGKISGLVSMNGAMEMTHFTSTLTGIAFFCALLFCVLLLRASSEVSAS